MKASIDACSQPAIGEGQLNRVMAFEIFIFARRSFPQLIIHLAHLTTFRHVTLSWSAERSEGAGKVSLLPKYKMFRFAQQGTA